jgi:hypothetical protein
MLYPVGPIPHQAAMQYAVKHQTALPALIIHQTYTTMIMQPIQQTHLLVMIVLQPRSQKPPPVPVCHLRMLDCMLVALGCPVFCETDLFIIPWLLTR